METVFATQFRNVNAVVIPPSAAVGDFAKLVITSQVQADTNTLVSGKAPWIYLQASTDGGASYQNGANTHQSMIYTESFPPSSGGSTRQNASWMDSAYDMIAGSPWDVEYTIWQPNEYRGSRNYNPYQTWKHWESKSIGTGGVSTPSLMRTESFGSLDLAMINAYLFRCSVNMTGYLQVNVLRREDIFPSPMNVYKVASLGPSTTGYGGWHEEVCRLLQAQRPDLKVVGRNFGRDGQGSAVAQINLEAVIDFSPDAVILDLALAEGAGNNMNGAMERHKAIINRLRAECHDPIIYLLNSNRMYAPGAANFKNLDQAFAMNRELAREGFGILVDTAPGWPVVAVPPNTVPFVTTYIYGSNPPKMDGTHPLFSANNSYLVPLLLQAVLANTP